MASRPLSVLVTGGGAPGIGGTIKALRENEERREVRIVAVDSRDDVVGKYLADGFHRVPPGSDDRFLGACIEICRAERIDVVLPQVTAELVPLAEGHDRLRALGVAAAVSPVLALRRVNNKHELLRGFAAAGYDPGRFGLVSSRQELVRFAERVGYPETRFVVKPPESSGMRGFRVVSAKRITVGRFLREKPDGVAASLDDIAALFDDGSIELLAMEFFPGAEYSVDVYRSPLSGRVVTVPRRRDVIRTGITFEGVLVDDEPLHEMSRVLSTSLDIRYAHGFQYRADARGVPRLLECNPRVQGTMIMSVVGGANLIWWTVKEALGEEVDLSGCRIRWGTRFKRYWGGVAAPPSV